MAKKTWKLGEVCQGGIISVEVKGNKVTIIGKEWDTSTGYNKKSNQSNAKEFCRLEDDASINDAYGRLNEYLHDLSTSYWASEIMEWIESKVKFERSFW